MKKMKKFLFFAAAITAMASCSSDDYVGNQDQNLVSGDNPITFGFNVPVATRADQTGATAASSLNNQFIVYGEKSEPANDASGAGEAPKTDGSSTHQLVFQNYVVNYTDNSAYTTTSNTKNWEYVGITPTYGDNVKPKAGETQTIKYWDYSATNYVFTAFSADNDELNNSDVKVEKITAKTTDNKNYDKGYTVTLTAAADPTKLYFSDRQVIDQTGAGSDRTAPNKYGGNVTLTFRNATSQVRAAMYETISGYDVKINNFYYADAAAPAFTAMTTADTDNKFYANVPNVTTDKGATLTVTYYESGVRKNQPKISVSGTTANNRLALGTNIKTQTKLGETSTEATYDQSDKSYTPVFPQETNTTPLKLKVDYTLKNTTTGETIKVTGATAEVPGQYLAWKPNFKYTYIFKISDNSNGQTGTSTDPAGLWPITSDAAVVVAEDGQAEYITTVSEPSITTYAKGSAVTTNNEYAAGEKIYTVVEDGGNLATLNERNMKLYKVTTSDNFPITEASVAEAIAEETCLNTAERTAAKIKFTADTFNYGKVIQAEDGSTVEMHATNDVVADFTTVANTYYAIQYIKTPATYYVDGGKTYTVSEYNAAGTLYTDAAATTEATSWTDGTTYYKRTGVNSVGTYSYKIVKVKP